ncbi:unnamed protein product, partial [Cuscuta epithymum]
MRFFFAILMVSNQMCTPHVVWEKTWKYLSDDIQHRQRLLLQFHELILSDDELKSFTLVE